MGEIMIENDWQSLAVLKTMGPRFEPFVKDLQGRLGRGECREAQAVDRVAGEIGGLYFLAKKSIIESVGYQIECGKMLAAKKASLAHGEWLPWLKENESVLGMNVESTPQRLIRLANSALTLNLNSPEEALSISRQTWGHVAHVGQNTGNDEWFTPLEYITAAKAVMGGIDLDPASCEAANRFVMADRFFSAEDDGLARDWFGRVWMNPPYSRSLEYKFCDKLISELCEERVQEAVVLVNNATETVWFQKLLEVTASVCFPRGRIKFLMANGELHGGSPLQGQAALYFGENVGAFQSEFKVFGQVLFNVKR